MQTPLRTTYRDVYPSARLEELIREQVEKLQSHHPDIIDCRVALAGPPRSRRRGGRYHVSIDVTVPGDQIVVSRDPGTESTRYEKSGAALRDAFRTARRLLDERAQRRRDRNEGGERITEALAA